MARSFARQVAVITGASSGIGWALAKALAQEGCKVGLMARRKDKLDTLAAEIQAAGGTVAVAPADVSERPQVLAAVKELAGALGPVDLLIANAGVGMPTLLDPVNVADVEQMYRVNVFGIVYALEAVLPDLLRRGQGHIVAISSASAFKGLPAESGYCSTKAAVNSYMEGLRIQLRSKGIAVSTICPGFVRTPMTDVMAAPMPWLMEADAAARYILWAVRRRRKLYTFPWQMALLMKATQWLPDWAIARAMGNYEEKAMNTERGTRS